jgi:glycosyltransferase involved in cell wall biosynthesis
VRERLRIGIVVSSAADGGGERYLRVLYEGLAGRGHQPVLIGDLPGWAGPSIPTGVGGKWSRKTLVQNGLSTLNDRRRIMSTVGRAHEAEPFDLFHLQYKREQVLVSKALSQLAPVVWTEHGRFPHGTGTSLLRALYRRASRSVHHVVCVSEVVEAEIRSLIGRSTPTDVVPNAVDLVRNRPPRPAERSDARRALGISPHTLVLVVASRLHWAKGIDLAIEAMDHLPPDSLLIIAGDGPDRERLEQLVGSRRVTFTGHLTDVTPIFRAADVFVLPSTRAANEGWPLALLEAAAHGLPVVAACDAGVDAQIAAAGGLLAPRDPVSLAARVVESAEGYGGSDALAWASRHGLPQWLDLYEGLLTEASGAVLASPAAL